MKYVLRPTQNDVLHYGVSHLKSKTGRGSGRYAWGSGDKNKSGVTRQKTRHLTSASKNKSGTDIQIVKWKQNISKSKGISRRGQFSTINNMRVVNQIAKDNVNCALCTYAMDLRERGVDVRANTKLDWHRSTLNKTTNSTIANWYTTQNGDSVKFKNFSTIYNKDGDPLSLKTGTDLQRRNSNIKSALIRQGDNTYGHLSMNNMVTDRQNNHYGWSLGGHDVFYKIENGQVMIYDGQTEEAMPYDKYMTINTQNGITMYPDGYLRTDNLKISGNISDNPAALATTTASTNYSPSNKTVTKIKAISQYSPPYVSENKEIVQYSPPYKTKETYKNITESNIKKIENKTFKISEKISNTFEKIVNKISDFKLDLTNQTNPIDMLRRWK